MRGVFEGGASAGAASLPTLLVVLLGGATGGFMAYQLEKMLAANKAEEEVTVEAKGA
jgi:hypothetical protein